jgi:hypothetical protein
VTVLVAGVLVYPAGSRRGRFWYLVILVFGFLVSDSGHSGDSGIWFWYLVQPYPPPKMTPKNDPQKAPDSDHQKKLSPPKKIAQKLAKIGHKNATKTAQKVSSKTPEFFQPVPPRRHAKKNL